MHQQYRGELADRTLRSRKSSTAWFPLAFARGAEMDKRRVMRLGGGISNDLLHGINIFSVYFSSFDVKQV